MFETLVLLKSSRECFPIVCFCFLFALAGNQPAVVLATSPNLPSVGFGSCVTLVFTPFVMQFCLFHIDSTKRLT